jgi:hypothetical protein
MSPFKVQFHRYSAQEGGRFSAVRFISAENFSAAVRMAELMASAMAEADIARRYIVASVVQDGLRGDECSSGWETADEFSARIKESA